ncbi:MAG: serine/threonine-protein kinase [Bacteroidota bacterium]
MDTQRWQQVKALFEAAVGRPGAERAAFLDEACGDPALRAEVEGLLDAHDDETPFLDTPVAPTVWTLLDQPLPLEAGTRLGPYRLLHLIGEGGMGVVYLAERADGQFERQVAIKLVRLASAERGLVRRFEAERRLLASLDHPGIARLLDGGLTPSFPGAPSGLPYLVMEVVEGAPLTVYADQQQLSVHERLVLFRHVCDAVQYAHQNLIVHSDLKPSNILVTPEGQVKLLDFGIAKLLAEEAASDSQGDGTAVRAMTPTYAAPEQLRGASLTTATDVYALGLLLCELLTGRRPYDVQGLTPADVERLVCREAAPRLSEIVAQQPGERPSSDESSLSDLARQRRTTPQGLRRSLRGDLDAVVAKALQKDPAQRYAFAAQLDDELGRHLLRLPVRARPATPAYRTAAFVRRHAVGVGTSVLILLALLGGIVATTHQARIAERRFDSLRALSNTLLSEVHDGIRDLPGATPARRTLVASALAYLDDLYREGRTDPALQFDLAEAYAQVGEVQGHPHYTNLGDLEGALESYRRAFELRAALWRRDSTDARVRLALADSYGHLAAVVEWRGGDEDVAAMRYRALDLLDPLVASPSPDLDALHVQARIQSEHGWELVFDGQHDEGLAAVDAAIDVLEGLLRDAPADLALALHLWRAYSYRADGLSFSGQSEALFTLMDTRGLPLLHRLEAVHPNHSRVQYGLHIAYGYLGQAQGRLGLRDDDQAPASIRRSLAYADAMVRIDPTNQKGEEAQSRALSALSRVYANRGRTDDALAALRRSLAIAQRRYDADPDNVEAANRVALLHRSMCRVFVRADRLPEALPSCASAIRLQETISHETTSLVYLGNLGSAYGHTARIHRTLAERAASADVRATHRAEALRWYRLGVETLRTVKAQHGDGANESRAWEVNPDSLAAEYASFQRGA